METMSITSNALCKFPFGLGMVIGLVTLKCECNMLTELPDSIHYLINLEELVISHNQLTHLPPTIGKYICTRQKYQIFICIFCTGMLTKLRYIFADDNQLQRLPDEICNCHNLSVLSVSCNHISELPSNIGQISRLKVLNIVRNCISSLPVSLLQLKHLSSLWISSNQSQPLVPLQYIVINNKNKLTCFMLPQTNIHDFSLRAVENNTITNSKHPKAVKENYGEYLKPKSYHLSLRLNPQENVVYKSSFSLKLANNLHKHL